MGCDIHCAIEQRDSSGRWRFVVPLDLDRDYNLFGILAGVRANHRPIAPQRGLPADLDPESHTSADSLHDPGDADEFGDHSRSWLTFAELHAYDWSTQLANSGVIPLRSVDWEKWRGRTRGGLLETYEPYTEWRRTPPHPPRSYCAGLTGAHVLDLRGGNAVDETLAERWISHPEEMPEPEDPPPGAIYDVDRTMGGYGWERGKKYPRVAYALVEWTITARDACRDFYDWMQRQEANSDMRIVFGFDS